MPGNKAFTQEDKQTNKMICKSLKINVDQFSMPQDTVSASSLPVQVADATNVAEATGADADADPGDEPPPPPPTIRPLRRSRRLALGTATGIT